MYKVLHIFSSYGGGISSLVINLVTHSDKEFQFDTLAYSYEGGDTFVKNIENAGGSCYLMPRIPKEGLNKHLSFLKQFFSKNTYDVIHCHISGFDALIFYRLAKRTNVDTKFIVHAHSTRYDFAPYRNKLARRINEFINYKVSNCYFYCSDLAADYIFNSKYLKEKPSYLIANGVDEKRYDFELLEEEAEKIKREIGIPSGNKILIHIGRFSAAKNHEFLLKVFLVVRNKMNNVSLLMVGNGELFEDVVAKSKKLGLERDVFFLGRRNDIPQLLKISDIALLPSLYEGLPTVGIESQAAGTPLILSDNITRQTDLGFGLLTYLPIHDIDQWVETCELLLSKNDCIHFNNIRAICKKGFTAQAAGELYCKLLKSIIKGEIK